MKKTVLVVLLVLGMMFTQQAWAITVIDFGRVFATSGTISYAGGSTSLVGSGISLDIVSDTTALNSYGLLGGALTFSTGTSTGSSGSSWFFAPGGTITVTGGVDVNGNDVIDLGEPSGTLMTGSFIGTPTVIDLGSGSFKIAGVAFEDSKNSDLAALFGLSSDGLGYGWDGFFNLGFFAAGTPPSGFTSTSVTSGDIINHPRVSEPASMSLLGLGLVGFVGRMIRRKARA